MRYKPHSYICKKILFFIILIGLTVAPDALAQDGEYQTPKISTEGLDISFSQPLREGGFVQINYISEFLTGIYQYLIGLSITAAIANDYGRWQSNTFVAGAVPSQVQKAKERMMNALGRASANVECLRHPLHRESAIDDHGTR